MEIGLEELGVQNGEFSKFSSMPPVEKQELVFTRKKKLSLFILIQMVVSLSCSC